MTSPIPRIVSVDVHHPLQLILRFDRMPAAEQVVSLAGWIKRGREAFASLLQPDVFARASIGAYGGNVTWDDDEGDLAIDSVHLEALAAEQTPFSGLDAAEWQRGLGLSSIDAADVLGLTLNDWEALIRSDDQLPAPIARLCRAVGRDPLIVEAHIKAA